MKKITSVFLGAAMILGVFACKEDQQTPVAEQATGSIKITVGTQLRAEGNLSGLTNNLIPGEEVVKKLQVWVFNGDIREKYGEAAATTLTLEGITVGSRDVFVFVNSDLAENSTKDALKEAQYTYATQDVAGKGLLMTQDGDLFTTVQVEEGKTAEQAITVKRLVARVDLRQLELNLDPEAKKFFDELADVEVAMYDVPKVVKMGTGAVGEPGGLLIGKKWSSIANLDTKEEAEGLLQSNVTFEITSDKAPYFYVNPLMEAGNTPMKLVLRGKPKKGGQAVSAEGLYTDAEGYMYYKVDIKGKENNNKILRNTVHILSGSITNMGAPNIDGAKKGSIKVNIQVADWEETNQNVTW
ncbi:fimbrial protein [Porphyromonas sp.]|uniref:fimbrial protein n=1 Tax=Porphyromonas sp. TaxID=1924944 RepID=UPI0026DBE81F|nr:fimbrial protein [Porphyromonas sp.]MDO4695660.1 fimbrial protein [Porphyromonas sp.]MDO4770319.1 fimbrial protein [Porphyromonas sp.]